ncbi:hypothetical protein CYK37_22670 [Mesorhizobium loti]|nr:hypothetical protein [Mesorhizobium loti]PLP57045.1 hypothetical protein CYK37_22670 [Mesorhizobium loti]
MNRPFCRRSDRRRYLGSNITTSGEIDAATKPSRVQRPFLPDRQEPEALRYALPASDILRTGRLAGFALHFTQ